MTWRLELLCCVQVRLVGFCDAGGEQCLVYEYMVNGTVQDHLWGKRTRLRVLFPPYIDLPCSLCFNDVDILCALELVQCQQTSSPVADP
jgi:hypothetical protein